MDDGFSFLKSKIARRFCTLFILCAFLPTMVIAVISYHKVVDQLEEQSFIRLKRETKAYGLGLFDRLVRAENELSHIGRNILAGYGEFIFSERAQEDNASSMFLQICQYVPDDLITPLYGSFDNDVFQKFLKPSLLESKKPFIVALPVDKGAARFFLGVNVFFADGSPGAIVGEISPEYLWGTGSQPILPPMTELFAYDAKGRNIMSTDPTYTANVNDLEKTYESEDLRIFHFTLHEGEYLGSFSNLFLESRYQRTGWVIILSQSRKDAMSALKQFSMTFPFIMILFLLLILYLTVTFIRKGLEPLEELKNATSRISKQDFSSQVDIKGDNEFAELGSAFNTMSQKVKQQFQTKKIIAEIDRAILSATDRGTILSISLQSMKSFFKCDMVMFARVSDGSRDFLKLYTLKGRRSDDPFIEYLTIEADDRDFLSNTDPHTIIDSNTWLPHFLKEKEVLGAKRYLALPICVDDTINRILILGWKEERQLTDDELNQARQIANQLAVALSNSNLLAELEHLAAGTIEALARTVDAKSRWTSGHSERVSELSGKIARAMGFTEDEINILTRGGLMHDIGKIGIALAILDKPDRLTDEEYTEVKNHPSIGAKILEPIAAFKNILNIVEQHHEKFDGTGYPKGLKGEEIDIRARILAVADVWDALVSDRPYRDGWVHERARKLITEGSGTHFDPQVVKIFLAVVES